MAESARARQDVENQTASRTSAMCGLCRGSVHHEVLPVKCTTGAKGRNQHDAAKDRPACPAGNTATHVAISPMLEADSRESPLPSLGLENGAVG